MAKARKREPESIVRALERARKHTRAALSEGVAAASALLDAASLGVGGGPSVAHRGLTEIARTLDQLSNVLSGMPGAFVPGPINSLLETLDGEISRWEERSRDDPDARAVLRAFLGLREVLWEIGLRPNEQAAAKPKARAAPSASGPPRRRKPQPKRSDPPRRPRVQRVDIDG